MRISRSAILLAAAAAGPVVAQERPRGPLADSIAPLFADRMWRRATWGALVVSLTRGDTLLSYRADRRFVPASTAKLFTTAAALHYLGTDFRFVTVLFADGRVRNGELQGDLVLYGTGDPTFALDTSSLALFADSVVVAGIHRIRGNIIGDASFLGGELTAPGWQPDHVTSAYAARPSALGANENRIRVTVEPGARRGAAARARLTPETDYYGVASVVITGRPGSRTAIRVRRGRGYGLVELSGTIAADAPAWSRTILVERPAEFAASLLRRLLEARGINVSGNTRAVVDDDGTRAHTMLMRSAGRGDAFAGAIAVHRSPTLDELVTMINHRSHNLSAELAFRTIGRMQGGTGTFASGARAVARFLTEEAGIPASAVQVRDGSGLSLLDEASPRSIVQLLSYMRRSPEGPAFFGSLPLVGAGMLSRMTETAAAGRLRAKTGTLSGVSALAGYVTTAGGEELAFSIVVNGASSIDDARLVQDSIGVRLSMLTRERGAGSGTSRTGP
ncbi:MAG: D-alanyl-D-alanine carboxypeptidase/D-alanyl-D-alanine-endopeptidase [Gemmatimonadales bacterium]|nr:D-alanyl-D-alanine carboxypeptidase/D-alanyl-D-alanine-endopeptidase [Gemmatimonadales bacterium]